MKNEIFNVFSLPCLLYPIHTVSFVHNSYLSATVHAVASVNIKDETWNNDFDAPHDDLDDDIDINN